MRIVGFITQAPVLSPPASCLPATLGHPWPSSAGSSTMSAGVSIP
jgi:hypothetical protein